MDIRKHTQMEDEYQLFDAASEMDDKYLTYWTDKQLFGVPIVDVVQIIKMQKITAIPEFPSYVKGIINLRGSIIPLIDVRLRLGKPEIEYNERTCIIVTSIREKEIGFIVDEVDEVVNIGKESITAPPKISVDCQNAYLTGIATQEDRIVLLVDAAKILSGEVIDSLIENGGIVNA